MSGKSPERIQRLRAKGWRRLENAKIVDRTSRWGNPYRAKDGYSAAEAVALAVHRRLTQLFTEHSKDIHERLERAALFVKGQAV